MIKYFESEKKENNVIINYVLNLLLSLYIVLPSYFAIEISKSIPLITASRIILLVIVIGYIIHNNLKISVKVFYNLKYKYLIKLFFSLLILVNMLHMLTDSYAKNEIFSILFEKIVLLWIVVKTINTKKKVEDLLSMLSYVSGIVAIISIIGLITGNNPFYYLTTTKREMLQASFTRLGVVRAEAGFGHPVYYGIYINIMIFISLYLYENKNRKYIFCIILNIIALFLCNSRGAIIPFIILILFKLIKEKNQLGIRLFMGIISILVFLLLMHLISPQVASYIDNTLSSINVFLGEETSIENYGTNAGLQKGINSRTNQLSGILYTLKNKPLMGFGPQALSKGLIKYYVNDKWQTTNTYDVGYVSIFCKYGLIGFLAYLFLYIGIVINIYRKDLKTDKFVQLFRYLFLIYILCMMSASMETKTAWIVLSIAISYINVLKNESMQVK